MIVTVDTSTDVRSVGIRFYENKDDLTQITAVMIIDSLGQRVTDSSYYFKHRDKITFDSADYQLVYTDDSENTNVSILDYARDKCGIYRSSHQSFANQSSDGR